jgi:mannitol-1-phosphate 5-dehydrogenase
VGFTGSRRLVGLGFGAIQAGLFVHDAERTGIYAPPLVVDVRPDLVDALRAAAGRFSINIAHADRVEAATLGPVDTADPAVPRDRAAIVAAIAEADELTSALPSVAVYRADGPTSPHRLVADGLVARTRPDPLLVVCAENHRQAAVLLEAAVLDAVPPADRAVIRGRVRWIDSVIGKMSGVVDDRATIESLRLAPITPTSAAAFLVESFDRILVSRPAPVVGPPGPRPAMPSLREVADLAPYEDAKLLGHNAVHALAGFLGMLLGLHRVAQVGEVAGFRAFLRATFLEESGRALIARHEGVDALFTPSGFKAFADDLLRRMVNPFLADTIERAARDPRRKLAWDDRLVGLIRLGLDEGVRTPRTAMAVAAGLEILAPGAGPTDQLALLRGLWPADVQPAAADAVRTVVQRGMDHLDRWRQVGFLGLRL